MAEKLEKRASYLRESMWKRRRNLQEDAVTDPHHVKAVKPLPSRKMEQEVPLIDCYVAPCKEGCPIHQDITTYLKLVSDGKYEEAMEVIVEKNPLPFITGTICAHNCMNKCTRNFYEEPVPYPQYEISGSRKWLRGMAF